MPKYSTGCHSHTLITLYVGFSDIGYLISFFPPSSPLRHNRQPARDRRGRDKQADAQHHQRAHPQPGARRPPLHRAVRALHRGRLRPLRDAGLAVRAAVVQDGAVPHLHHQLLQHLHSHPNVHGQVSRRSVPGEQA